eukprot:scaffold13357_cov19-Tisochrysis_lutea.AAC.2
MNPTMMHSMQCRGCAAQQHKVRLVSAQGMRSDCRLLEIWDTHCCPSGPAARMLLRKQHSAHL